MPVWNLIQRVYVRPIASCKSSWPLNAFEIARRLGLSEPIIQDAMKMTIRIMMSIKLLKNWRRRPLESRKRLDTIQEVEQENLKFNRALRKLYNELTREREKTELNKAREEAKEIVDMALSESDPDPSRPSC